MDRSSFFDTASYFSVEFIFSATYNRIYRFYCQEVDFLLSLQEIMDGVSVAAQEFPIKKAELFGSYAYGRNTPDSDVDLLMEFHTSGVSLLTLNRLKYRLEEILHTDVDIIHGPLSDDCMIEIDRRIPVYGA